jgi:hypothetical protein
MIELPPVNRNPRGWRATELAVDRIRPMPKGKRGIMKRELLKGFAMVALIIALALVTAVASANAQSHSSNQVVADVPFEFSVGYKAMPAGKYSVQPISVDDGLLIQSADGKTVALRQSDATIRLKDKSHARLVFHRYGERYFLAEVWNGADNSGRQLIKSQEESAIQRELAITPANDPPAHVPQAIYETVEILAVLR